MTALPRTFTVRPRTLVMGITAILALTTIAVAVSVLVRRPEASVLLPPPADESVVISYAGILPSEEETPLANPLGIASDGERLYVAEADAGRIAVFLAEGTRIGEIPVPPSSGARLAYPTGVAVTDDGRLAVVDGAGGRVVLMEASITDEPEVLGVLGGDEGGGAPIQPTSVTYGDGLFLVSDAVTHDIKVYDAEGTYLRSIGLETEPPLVYPAGVVQSGAVVYVADSNTGVVSVLTSGSGRLLSTFPDTYSLPRGMAPLGGGVVLVDVFGPAVYICDVSGERVHVIDNETVPDAGLSAPEGVTWIPEQGRLYVTDGTRGRVIVFNVRI